MACDHCRSLDLDGLLDGEKVMHHSNFEDLETCSLKGDCPLCIWITDRLEDIFEEHELEREFYEQAKVYYRVPGHLLQSIEAIERWHGISHVTFLAEMGDATSYHIDVELFVARGSDLAESGTISGRHISPYSNDNGCFQLARKWRDTCLETHGGSCLQTTEQRLPTRIIDVGPSDGSREPTLRITSGESGEWVALSHCWGTVSRFVTDSSNASSGNRIIPLRAMPQTFRDAVITTRELGYRYLWIDSLCIIQDNHNDWAAESIRMRDYYKYATMTISADAAPGDHVGFLDHRRANPESVTIILASNEEIGVRDRIKCPTFRDRDTFIARRAWTLQEFVLGPRSLLFTAGQIVWECHTRKYCESDDNSQGDVDSEQFHCMKRFFSVPSLGKEHFPDFQRCFEPSYRWYSLVNDYMSRDLTIKKDIFPAISSLARELQQQTGKTYVAGIWMEDIHKALLWITSGAGRLPEAYYAPSWSWAALEILPAILDATHDIYRLSTFESLEVSERRARLISHEVILEDNDPFGCVSSGSIRIHGKSLPASQWQGKNKPHFNSYKEVSRCHYFEEDDSEASESADQLICYFDILEENMVQETLLHDTIMFQISSWMWGSGNASMITLGLLLVRVENTPIDTYRRVGIAEIPNVDGLADEHWEMKDITII